MTPLDMTPSVTEIDWSGRRPAPPLDAATETTRQLFLQALDTQLDRMVIAPMPMGLPQTDPTTMQVVQIGCAAMVATDDAETADALHHLLLHIADLSEQLQTQRAMTSASMAVQHQQHRRTVIEREARHA